MGEKMEEKYSVIFTGKIIEGLDLELVKSNLITKLKISSSQVEALFKNSPRVIKTYDSKDSADKLIAALKSCGAISEIDGQEQKDDSNSFGISTDGDETSSPVTDDKVIEEETYMDIIKGWTPLEWGGVTIGVLAIIGYFFSGDDGNDTSQRLQSGTQSAQPKVSPEDTQRKNNSSLISDIWSAYERKNAVHGVSFINVKGDIVEEGTVPSSALNTIPNGPLPAYVACYDYVSITQGMGDIESDMCIYYIKNPTRGTGSFMWRGKKYISQIHKSMKSDGFKSK